MSGQVESPQSVRESLRRIDVQLDWVLIPAVLFVLGASFSFEFALTVGDWDYWIDWRDRRWWPLITPLALTPVVGVFSYTFWKLVRLPVGGTLSILMLVVCAWISRLANFHHFAGFPLNMIFPSTYIALGLIVDCVLLLTRSFFFTGVFGAFLMGLLVYPLNWPMNAPFMVPVEMRGTLMTVADVMGFEYVRTAMPEYVRIIEQSTLRTFGDAVVPLTAVFAGFLTIMFYWFWTWVGSLAVRTIWIKKAV